jgi:DNA mismatch endonuclease (patch repair protein)
MADIVDKATRSRMMAGIGGKNTKPEMVLRRALHAQGFRFRLHVASLPGKPDIVLPKRRAAILVHGCFWHRHPGCRFATTPATRPDFWSEKFRQNVLRDQRNQAALRDQGWRVATVWECDLRLGTEIVDKLAVWLRESSPTDSFDATG